MSTPILRTILPKLRRIGMLLGGCVALGACSVETTEPTDSRIRLDVPAGSVKVAVLGTAHRGSQLIVPRDFEGNRRSCGLTMVVPETGRVFWVDPSPDVIPLLRDWLAGEDEPSALAAPRQLEAVLITRFDHFVAEGLAAWLAENPRSAPLPVYGASPHIVPLMNHVAFATDGEDPRLQPRPVLGTQPIQLASSLTVLPLWPEPCDGSLSLGYRIRGAEKTLLYLPRCEQPDALSPGVQEALGESDIALLDATPRLSPVAGAAAPLSVRGTLTNLGKPAHLRSVAIRFIGIAADDPALDPASSARFLLIAAGFDLAADGLGFWL